MLQEDLVLRILQGNAATQQNQGIWSLPSSLSTSRQLVEIPLGMQHVVCIKVSLSMLGVMVRCYIKVRLNKTSFIASMCAGSL